MRPPDNNKPDHQDPELTEVIARPDGVYDEDASIGEQVLSGDAFDAADASKTDAAEDDSSDNLEGMSPLRRRWQRLREGVGSGDVRRHLPYAVAAAVTLVVVIAVLVVVGAKPKSSDAVSDTAAESDTSATQSFDDITGLLQGQLGATTQSTVSETSAVSETPVDVPPPLGEEPSIEGGDIAQPMTPATVTVTDTAPIETGGGDPVTTETATATETSPSTTVTDTRTVNPWPNVSIEGGISVQPTQRPGTGWDGRPSTVTVVVPAETTAPRPSTVTVVVPATTTPPSKTLSPKPTGCPTATTTPKTTTPSTTTKRPPAATATQRTTTAPVSTSKKPTTTTTTARPCK
ncbi:hypothetical protein [Nocardia altamirensis]|uniref:hypothetical protein n=1 Tax=Nocardia altamirensis TaxID=472158 RepID=UPI00114D0D5D|nr:hypothetical protein [Nocardia altamirensis]